MRTVALLAFLVALAVAATGAVADEIGYAGQNPPLVSPALTAARMASSLTPPVSKEHFSSRSMIWNGGAEANGLEETTKLVTQSSSETGSPSAPPQVITSKSGPVLSRFTFTVCAERSGGPCAVAAAIVPEPASLLLFGSALLVVGSVVRRILRHRAATK